jgi:hypothetical protein
MNNENGFPAPASLIATATNPTAPSVTMLKMAAKKATA